MGYQNCGSSGCCGPSGVTYYVRRRYWTNEERVAWLEDYASQLEKELEGVKQRIDRIKGS